ncbi:D-alanine--D-alanine ligase family protein [Aspergillus stella-maris]|uniref:D-alanine--D-alanine ligase family protein n=1 Tax=Aspergillus stella-maris TaxID=1810926 RepID=UPI003CCDCCB6
MAPLTIAVISEQRSSYLQDGFSQQDCAALTHDGETEAIVATLKNLGHKTILVPGIKALVQHLAKGDQEQWGLVFNVAQGFFGSAREAQVPALLEAYQVPFTFADADTMGLCQNKRNTKIVLDHYQVPTAPFQAISARQQGDSIDELLDLKNLSYPLFVKLTTEGSSKGVNSYNQVSNATELQTAVDKTRSNFPGHTILVESFLAGREFSVSLLGTGESTRVIAVREHIHTSQEDGDQDVEGPDAQNFLGWESKSSHTEGGLLKFKDFDIRDKGNLEPQIQNACRLAVKAWTVLDCRDAGRVDMRFDSCKADAKLFVMEVNPISGLLPGHSPLAAGAQVSGISFDELLAEIVDSAVRRGQGALTSNGLRSPRHS